MSGIIFGGGATIDLTAPPTNIGTTTPVAVNSTIFTALPANNTSALVASGSSLTGSNAQSLVNLSQTWNTTGTPTAIFANITNTASNTFSRLVDLQISGVSKFVISKNGSTSIYGNLGLLGYCAFSSSDPIGNLTVFLQNTSDTGLRLSLDQQNIGGSFGAGRFFIGATDIVLTRDAAAILAQRNGINTQTSRLYKSFTDASNHTRSAWQFDANGVVLAGESAGTGDANISITLSPKGTGSIRTTGKIYPATDALAAQTAAGIFAGTGAPNNANGDNGDFYLRSDGDTLTTIYQKRAGTWTGIV